MAAECQVELIEAGSVGADFNWEDYDMVGFASGIAYSKFYDSSSRVAEQIPAGKGTFFIYTCAKNDKDFAAKIKKVVEERGAKCFGTYGCRGFNTYGPLKLIGEENLALSHNSDEKQIENMTQRTYNTPRRRKEDLPWLQFMKNLK